MVLDIGRFLSTLFCEKTRSLASKLMDWLF